MDEAKQQEALHYLQLQQYKKAQEFLKSCLSEKPNDGYAMYLLATCYNDAGDYNEALECALDCLTMEDSGFAFSKSAPLNSLLGAIYMNLDEYEKSEGHYLEALRLQPDNGSCMAKYAYLLMTMGNTEKAQSVFAEAKRISPLSQSVRTIENGINLMASKGKKQPFVPDFGGGEISADDLMLIGNSYIERLQYEEAKECYRQAFLIQPENPELFRVLNGLEKHMSLWMRPNRIIVTIGKIKVWIAFLVILFALAAMGQDKLFTVVAVIYMIVLVYSHTAGKLYDLFMKIRSKL